LDGFDQFYFLITIWHNGNRKSPDRLRLIERAKPLDTEKSILFTSRIRSAKWDNIKRAHDIVFGEAIYLSKQTTLMSAKIYRNDADLDDILLVSEWQSFEDLRLFALEHGTRFNDLAGTQPDEGEDLVWHLAEPMGARLASSVPDPVTEEEQQVLSITRIKQADWHSLRIAFEFFFRVAINQPSDQVPFSVNLYWNDSDSNDALLVSDWRTFNNLNAFQQEHEQELNRIIGLHLENDRAVTWRLSDAMVST
jgi:hypothetical protein